MDIVQQRLGTKYQPQIYLHIYRLGIQPNPSTQKPIYQKVYPRSRLIIFSTSRLRVSKQHSWFLHKNCNTYNKCNAALHCYLLNTFYIVVCWGWWVAGLQTVTAVCLISSLVEREKINSVSPSVIIDKVSVCM